MKRLLLGALVIQATATAALADDCKERFARYMEGSLEGRPGQGRIISKQGGVTTENEYIFLSTDHGLYKPIKPDNSPWTLTYMGAMYTSADEGKTWKKVHTFDREKQKAANLETVRKQVQSATNAICGEEEIDGVKHITYEVDMVNTEHAYFQMHNKYWVNPETGAATKTTSKITQGEVESYTVQFWKPADGVSLPVPE